MLGEDPSAEDAPTAPMPGGRARPASAQQQLGATSGFDPEDLASAGLASESKARRSKGVRLRLESKRK